MFTSLRGAPEMDLDNREGARQTVADCHRLLFARVALGALARDRIAANRSTRRELANIGAARHGKGP